MTDAERREAVRQFIRKWSDPNNGNENQHARSYWIEVFKNILGADDVTDRLDFEKNVIVDGHTKHIDAYIPETHVLIEQKSKGIALEKPGLQSGGDKLTPYEQAKRYNDNLAYDEKARWIVTSNFSEIWIYDMNTQTPEPLKLSLTDLQNKYSLIDFLIKKEVKKLTDEEQVSKDAGAIVGLLRNALEKQYVDMEDLENQQSLNALCVRLVFCLYAEDADIFGRKNMFSDYLSRYTARDMRRAIIDLFKVLDIKEDERDPYLDEELAQFPYVNGGLFSDEHMIIPQFTDEIRDILLEKAAPFDWAGISPTIFGAIFESTLNADTRRKYGMVYTSVKDIHKVIGPLFLNSLDSELREIESIANSKIRLRKLDEFQDKLANLKFFDPACGSGNFLTETYISLRQLENEAIVDKEAAKRGSVEGQISLTNLGADFKNPIKVSIHQFYGIEINDFACTVAKTALWIAESQMIKKTEDVLHGFKLEFLPLKSYVNIVEDNALKLDWNDVLPANECSYIMGNPPFVGAAMMTKKQKQEAVEVFGKIKLSNSIDYVGAWYHKAAEYMQNTRIKAAFVSTNSITQGEQVAALWDKMLNNYHTQILFAYRTFIWNNEATEKAHVHCVIIGFCCFETHEKRMIIDGDNQIVAKNINPYLVDAPNTLISSRAKPLCDVPIACKGNMPIDNGNFIFTEDEMNEVVSSNTDLQTCFHQYVGARDYINGGEKRYCIWLDGVSPALYRKSPEIMKRIEAVREFRSNSSAKPTQKAAERPSVFYYISYKKQPTLVIPEASSWRRRYVPMGFIDAEIIPSNLLVIIQGAGLYEFGVIISNVHMSWMRLVAGRLKSDYRYSGNTVYNTFPWPTPTEKQRDKIEQTARGILDARNLYPDNSLADLYDPLTMPPELQKAHIANDKAVMAAYGFSTKMTEADCVAELMKMYQELVD